MFGTYKTKTNRFRLNGKFLRNVNPTATLTKNVVFATWRYLRGLRFTSQVVFLPVYNFSLDRWPSFAFSFGQRYLSLKSQG